MHRLAMLLLCAVACTGFSTPGKADAPPPKNEAAAKPLKKKIVLKARPIVKAPPRPVTSGGSGFYVGINGGYDWGRATFTGFPFTDTSINVRSGMAGLTFGYNAQAGALVYGIETDLDAAWMKSTNWAFPPCFGCEVQLRYFGTLRGRLAYAVGQALPYVTAGLAYGGVSASSMVFGTSQTDVKLGWTVGAGVEYAVTGPWSVKAEYLYFELDDMDCGPLVCGATPVGVKFKGNLVRGGLNYRF